MTSQTFLTVAEAAVRVGKSRQTLFDKIKRGQLSATVNGDGIKVIDVSELLRVFGHLLSDDELSRNQANRAVQPAASSLTATLQLELELANLRLVHAQKELETSNRQLEEMRVRERQSIEDRTQLLGVIERQTLLLAAPRAAPAPRTKAAEKATSAPAPPPAKALVKPKTPAKKAIVARKTAPSKAPAKAMAKASPASRKLPSSIQPRTKSSAAPKSSAKIKTRKS